MSSKIASKRGLHQNKTQTWKDKHLNILATCAVSMAPNSMLWAPQGKCSSTAMALLLLVTVFSYLWLLFIAFLDKCSMFWESPTMECLQCNIRFTFIASHITNWLPAEILTRLHIASPNRHSFEIFVGPKFLYSPCLKNENKMNESMLSTRCLP